MIPSTGDIMRRRATVVSVARGVSLLCVLWIPVLLLSWIGEGLSDDDLFELSYYMDKIALILILPLFAIAFVVFARPLSKWIVPMHEPHCPRCDHLLTHLTTPRCSECGLQLPDELIQDDTPNIEPPPHQ